MNSVVVDTTISARTVTLDDPASTSDVFTLTVEIRCIDATIVTPFENFPTELEGGALVVDGSAFNNCIPFPLDVRGNIVLRLDDFPGRSMQITSRGCILCAVSDEVYLESFPGSDA